MGIVHHHGTKLLWVACLCVQLAACGVLAETSGQISQQELVSQIEAGTAPLILDVRTAEEYASGHIPGAINIHFREIDERLAELNLSDGQPVVVYCERGIRASIAEQTLEAAGIENILHLEGDISQWRRSDLPLESPKGLENNEMAQQQPATALANPLKDRWIITAEEAKQLIDQGATLLDTRKLALKRLQGSTYVDWQEFSPEDATIRGRLLDDDELLSEKLQTLGIAQHNPVVVLADPPGGWGEDGRIVWMLRTLGHHQAVIVDGGFKALMDAGVPVQRGKREAIQPGDFVVNRESNWEIQQDDLKEQLGNSNLVVIDTREEREFAGKTPYGEERGGHVPGAIHLYFKEFLGSDGKLLPTDAIRSKLERVGISPETQVVVYCTGGIRSGWMATVLATLGYQVKNYAGSMWEWSAGPEASYPLESL
ncbi:MAG: rhodanese-like domain-containing protein [Cyanobacteria bacterium P01_D01_bin.56]